MGQAGLWQPAGDVGDKRVGVERVLAAAPGMEDAKCGVIGRVRRRGRRPQPGPPTVPPRSAPPAPRRPSGQAADRREHASHLPEGLGDVLAGASRPSRSLPLPPVSRSARYCIPPGPAPGADLYPALAAAERRRRLRRCRASAASAASAPAQGGRGAGRQAGGGSAGGTHGARGVGSRTALNGWPSSEHAEPARPPCQLAHQCRPPRRPRWRRRGQRKRSSPRRGACRRRPAPGPLPPRRPAARHRLARRPLDRAGRPGAARHRWRPPQGRCWRG